MKKLSLIITVILLAGCSKHQTICESHINNKKENYQSQTTYTITSKNNIVKQVTINEQYKSQGYSFIMVKGPITDAMVDGVKKDTTSESRIELEMELWNTYNNDKALIMFTNTYNMYFCER